MYIYLENRDDTAVYFYYYSFNDKYWNNIFKLYLFDYFGKIQPFKDKIV